MFNFRSLLFAGVGSLIGVVFAMVLIAGGLYVTHWLCPAVIDNYISEIIQDQRCLVGRSFFEWLIATIQARIGAFNFLAFFVLIGGLIGLGIGILVFTRRAHVGKPTRST